MPVAKAIVKLHFFCLKPLFSSQSVSQSVSRSVSRSVGRSVSWSVGQSVSRSIGWSVGQSVKSVSQVSQLVSQAEIKKKLKFYIILVEGFVVDLKTFLSLALPNLYFLDVIVIIIKLVLGSYFRANLHDPYIQYGWC